jgi:hypothetical protein
MYLSNVVGISQNLDGTTPNTRGCRSGETAVSQVHGKYMEAAYRGNVFFAANQSAVTFAAGLLLTTQVGLIVSNPAGSGKNLVLLQAEYTNTGTIVHTAGLVVMAPQSTAVTHTTALTPLATNGGGNLCVAKADSGATIPVAPVVAKTLYSVLSTATTVGSAATTMDLDGSIIIPPGGACAIAGSAAGTAFCSLTWEEVPTTGLNS